MRKWHKQLLSWLLVAALTVQLFPAQAFAVSDDPIIPTDENGTPIEIVNDARSDEAIIIGEVTDARGECEKHFRLSDGTFTAVEYGVPVHYEENGQWVDIDNTLSQELDGGSTYQASNGEHIQSFPDSLATGEVMATSVGTRSVKMYLWDGVKDSMGPIVTEPMEPIKPTEIPLTTETPAETATPDAADTAAEPQASAVPSEAPESTPAEPETSPADNVDAAKPDSETAPASAETPEEAPEVSAAPSPEASAEPSPEVSAEPSPEVSAEPSPEAETEGKEETYAFNPNSAIRILSNGDETNSGGSDQPKKKTDVVPASLSSSVLYADVYPGVDLQYDLFSYNVKESIILKERPSKYTDLNTDANMGDTAGSTAGSANPYEYVFFLELTDMVPELMEDGSIQMLDGKGQEVYEIPAPYMTDAAGNFSDAVTYTLAPHKEGYLLSITADAQWLDDEAREYPVTIDPTIISKENSSKFVGNTVSEHMSGSAISSSQMACGYHSNGPGQMEMYFKITELPEVPKGCTVVDAVVGLSMTDYTPQYNSSAKMTMEIHQVTTKTTGTDWIKNLKWDEKPTYNQSMDFVTTHGNQIGSYRTWNITRAAKEWYEDSSTNYGLAVSSDQTDATAYRAWFGYSYSAIFIVSYRDMVGIEGYYTTETQSAGRAGTGYVGDYSSFLTVVKDDLSYANTAMPFSISHVYNSSLGSGNLNELSSSSALIPDYSKMKMGHGWQISVQESVKYTTIGDTKYLVYRDGDGTQHYFTAASGSSTYKDEDGLGLEITVSSTTSNIYTLKDQDGNKKYFKYGYLTYLEDGNGNRVCFLYNGKSYSASGTSWHPTTSGSYLSSIVSVNKGQSASIICTLSYNSSNYLTSIKTYDGRTTQFTYDSSGQLSSMKHPDATYAYYTYDTAGQLLRMYDGEAKYGAEYAYNNGGVSQIKEYTAASNTTNTRTYGAQVQRKKNGIQETVYQYDGDDRTFDTSDDIFTRYAFDYFGRTINATSLNSNQSQILGVTSAAYTENATRSKKNNRMEKDAQSGIAGVNLLRSSGMETHDGYSNAGSYWKRIGAGGATSNAVVKQNEKARHGTYALKTYLNSSASVTSSGMYQQVTLPAGTYTFSAYVNTSGIENFSPGGVHLEFQNTAGKTVAAGDALSHTTPDSIDNGWQRIYVTTTLSSGTYRCSVIQNAYGAAYFDDLQLEIGNAPSSANLLQDGDFRYSRNDEGSTTHEREWTDTNLYIYQGSDVTNNSDNYVGFLWGNPTGMKRGSQEVPINGPATDTYLLSGWAYAYSAADTETTLTAPESNTKRYFGLIARCNYSDGTKEYFCMPFNDDYAGWQYASCVIAPKKANQSKTINSIMIITAYDYNINGAAFDKISLRQEPCTTYTYDSDGNVTAVNATGNSAKDMTYAAGTNKLTKSVTKDSGTYQYTYGDSNNDHLVTKITNDNVSMNITYDAMGNSTASTLKSGSSTFGKTINTAATYTADGSLLTSQTNSNGYTTSYSYENQTIPSSTSRRLSEVTDSFDAVTHYTYYAGTDRPQLTYQNSVISTDFNYTCGMLTSVVRGGFISGNTTKQNQTYTMGYDGFGNMTSIAVGSRTLASYKYGTQNKNLQSMAYGNGAEVSYTYDNLDRVTNEVWSSGQKYQYVYNSEGNLAKKLDSTNDKAVNYEYDSLGRLIYSYQTKDGSVIQETEHIYDTENRIKSQSWQLGSTAYSESYTYSASDGSLSSMTTKRNGAALAAVTFTYDALKRLSTRQIGNYKQTFTYRDISGTTQTTTQVAAIQYTSPNVKLAYGYDSAGNIESVSATGWASLNASYKYDKQGQLTSETNTKGTFKYTFDTYGNIRSVSGAETHTYTYGNSQWLDLLTAYDGQSITYDTVGNPLSYYNGTRWTFTWQNGRQLATASKSGTSISYTYDVAGIRDSKKVGSTTYSYITQNGQVVKQTGGGHTLEFVYDTQGRPMTLVYDGTAYTYMLNLQGDVIALLDSSGGYAAWYVYDAWGKVLTVSGSNTTLANANPLRYRGYYYDTETGLYYLQSRYYDPVVKRFINADVFASTGQGFQGYNMFSYCNNYPVGLRDNGGNVSLAAVAIGGLVGGITGAFWGGLTSVAAGGSFAQGALTGGISGALSGATATLSMPAAIVGGAITSCISYCATAENITVGGVFVAGILGAANGALSSICGNLKLGKIADFTTTYFLTGATDTLTMVGTAITDNRVPAKAPSTPSSTALRAQSTTTTSSQILLYKRLVKQNSRHDPSQYRPQNSAQRTVARI